MLISMKVLNLNQTFVNIIQVWENDKFWQYCDRFIFKLETKATSILTQREYGKVLSQVQTAHLWKIWKFLSKAQVYKGLFVRELLIWEIFRPVLSREWLESNFNLKWLSLTSCYLQVCIYALNADVDEAE